MTKERIKCKFCEFAVESEDHDELIDVISRHNKKNHPDKEVPPEEVQKRIQKIE